MVCLNLLQNRVSTCQIKSTSFLRQSVTIWIPTLLKLLLPLAPAPSLHQMRKNHWQEWEIQIQVVWDTHLVHDGPTKIFCKLSYFIYLGYCNSNCMVTRLNLSIPKPADDLLALVTEIAPLTAVTSTKTGKTTTKQGVKLMEANESLTARYASQCQWCLWSKSFFYSRLRNLFAIEYLKSHSPTVSEFKAIYDALDHDVNKVNLYSFFHVFFPLTILSMYSNTKCYLVKRNERLHQSQALLNRTQRWDLE